MVDSRRRQFLQTVGGTGALLCGGVGTAVANPGKRGGASAGPTLYEFVAESPDFATLELALEETGLGAELDGRKQYTVFAPDDDAFADLLDALSVSADELLDRDDLANILLFHVTNGRRYASSVVDAPQITMANGGTLPVDGTALNGSGLGSATIEATDIEASNGVAHRIDGVLLP